MTWRWDASQWDQFRNNQIFCKKITEYQMYEYDMQRCETIYGMVPFKRAETEKTTSNIIQTQTSKINKSH